MDLLHEKSVMRAVFKRPYSWRLRGRQYKQAALKDIADRMSLAITIATDTILERTPVYTGRTLVNFQWSVDGPVQGVRKPIASSGLPGRTSTLPLGSEPRRSANAAVVLGESKNIIARVMRGSYKGDLPVVYLVNNSPSYYGVEYGTYSDKARTPPGGITRTLEVKIAPILR